MWEKFQEAFSAAIPSLESFFRSKMRSNYKGLDKALDCDDLLQLTWLSAAEYYRTHGDSQYPLPVLIKLKAENEIQRYYRLAKRAQQNQLQRPHATEASEEIDACKHLEQREIVEEAQSLIDPIEAGVAVRQADGETYEQIALDLKIDPATLRKQISRMRAKLESRFGKIIY